MPARYETAFRYVDISAAEPAGTRHSRQCSPSANDRSAVSMPKDPQKVAAGKASARARWGEHGRIVRIDDLDPAIRAAVVALVNAARSQRAADEKAA